MTLPDEAIEHISRQFMNLPDDPFERFIANHLSTANYAVPLVDSDTEFEAAEDREFFTNTSIWEAILLERLRRTDIKIVLDGFFIFEWLPRSPGLFFTREGRDARTEARNHIAGVQDGLLVYNPYGKASMLDGGVGNIRLKPINIGGTPYCFMSASSSGICHEGLPVAMPLEYRNDCIDEIAERGAVVRKLVGQLKFVPEELVALYRGYAGVPQLYLEVQDVVPATHEQSRRMQDLRVSVAVSFMSSFEGLRKIYAAYANFDPRERGSLRRNVKWMEQEYVIGQYQGKIITDFDQQKANFAAATFSLDKVMNRALVASEVRSAANALGLDSEKILKHQSQISISIGEDNPPVINIYQPTAESDKAKPPDSLGQALIHLIWPINPVWRFLLLILAGVLVGGYLLWGSLPEATKTEVLSRILQRQPPNVALTPEQTKEFRFNIAMAESEEGNSKLHEALYYYQRALQINPQDTELKKKVDTLRELIAKGASK